MSEKSDPLTEKRVTASVGTGGSRRHDDPPSWLDPSLPLQKRRELLDRAIGELKLKNQQSMQRGRPKK
ncbi:MAG: hypothetical protein JWQ13_1186 [Ramlibacter sp.]|nr:hypothetical protein [Ramlibacter sp.]